MGHFEERHQILKSAAICRANKQLALRVLPAANAVLRAETQRTNHNQHRSTVIRRAASLAACLRRSTNPRPVRAKVRMRDAHRYDHSSASILLAASTEPGRRFTLHALLPPHARVPQLQLSNLRRARILNAADPCRRVDRLYAALWRAAHPAELLRALLLSRA